MDSIKLQVSNQMQYFNYYDFQKIFSFVIIMLVGVLKFSNLYCKNMCQ